MGRRTLLVEAIGATVAIDGSDLTESAWAAVRKAWSGALAANPSAQPAVTVGAHGHIGTASMLASLSMDVTLAALQHGAGHLLMLHAAAVASPEGRVVALVGPSGRGKTTAARHLGTSFGYVSDESVGITADGRVLPYRKPLSIIEDDPLVKAQRSPRELGLKTVEAQPLRLAALVLLERSEDAVAPHTEELSPTDALVGLAREASYLGRLDAPLATLRSHIDAVGGAHRIVYRDVATLEPEIRRLVGREAVRTPRQASVGGDSRARTRGTPAPASVGIAYRQTGVVDELPLGDDRIAVLVRTDRKSSKIAVLDGIAPAIWASVAAPASLGDIVESVVRRHGEPSEGDAASLVAASLSALLEEGLLEPVHEPSARTSPGSSSAPE